VTPNSPLKAVVFDVGGVLLDWNPRYLYRSLLPDEESIERFLSEVCTPEWNLAQDRGRTWAEAVAELTARFPEQAELIRAYDERWVETCGGPLHETVEVLEELQSKGIPTYALTNFSAEKWPVAVERYDFLHAFDDAVVVSGVEGVVKPDPEIYRILLNRFGLDPASTFFTDDVEGHVRAARAVGMRAEVFVDGATMRRQLVDANLLT
jgi:2-haloacid dehalogenase